PRLLNFPNGTLELRQPLTLREHRREDFITKITAAPYLPDARHELWERHLIENIPDPEVRAWDQNFAGYSLTGDTSEDIFCFANGPTGGGKTTHVQALAAALGDYAVSVDFSLFLAKKHNDGPKEALASLRGARLVISVESGEDAR